MNTRQTQMRELCEKFHHDHPLVWTLFVRFTNEMISRGRKNYGVSAIFERIRWEIDSVGGNGATAFKLNNNFRAFYARRFHKAYPVHDGFFRTRKQTSEHRRACNLPELGPQDYK
jgi:hypothetical protein